MVFHHSNWKVSELPKLAFLGLLSTKILGVDHHSEPQKGCLKELMLMK